MMKNGEDEENVYLELSRVAEEPQSCILVLSDEHAAKLNVSEWRRWRVCPEHFPHGLDEGEAVFQVHSDTPLV